MITIIQICVQNTSSAYYLPSFSYSHLIIITIHYAIAREPTKGSDRQKVITCKLMNVII